MQAHEKEILPFHILHTVYQWRITFCAFKANNIETDELFEM